MSTPETFTAAEFAQLKAYHDNNDLVAYYDYLYLKGYDYGRLAKSVVIDDGLAGVLARDYAEAVAADSGLSFGDGQGQISWNNLSLALMQADFELREPKYINDPNSVLELAAQDIQTYHNEVFTNQFNLPAGHPQKRSGLRAFGLLFSF
jgi:hypothetical protein